MNEKLKKISHEKLYPSCSEIVWKLNVLHQTKVKILRALENKEQLNYITYMAGSFPDKFLGNMINLLSEEKGYGTNLDDIKLKMVKNDNGESWKFIKEGFKLAKLCLNKKMKRKEAQKILNEVFDGDEDDE